MRAHVPVLIHTYIPAWCVSLAELLVYTSSHGKRRRGSSRLRSAYTYIDVRVISSSIECGSDQPRARLTAGPDVTERTSLPTTMGFISQGVVWENGGEDKSVSV